MARRALTTLLADCTDVQFTFDDVTTWCYALHPVHGGVCLAGRTERLAAARVLDYFRLADGRWSGADATACTLDDGGTV